MKLDFDVIESFRGTVHFEGRATPEVYPQPVMYLRVAVNSSLRALADPRIQYATTIQVEASLADSTFQILRVLELSVSEQLCL